MKHLTYADQSVLVGDEAADTLVRYAAILSDTNHADTVIMNAIESGGDSVVATFVLGAGVNLMAQTTSSELNEPGNSEAVDYMNSRIGRITSAPRAHPTEEPWPTQPDV
ncbi:MAG: hypothetical protein JWM50_1777 [Microbacteriaceae bacterium]|jgi:hypothetical protein|nr:hypothetical protein [Microbacteriaceae bacterium]